MWLAYAIPVTALLVGMWPWIRDGSWVDVPSQIEMFREEDEPWRR